jgi:RsiW-degrading membrane proteinase PrsW (M82 family)
MARDEKEGLQMSKDNLARLFLSGMGIILFVILFIYGFPFVWCFMLWVSGDLFQVGSTFRACFGSSFVDGWPFVFSVLAKSW